MSQQALTAQELADRLGGVLQDCPPDRVLAEVRPLDEAGPGSVSFLSNPKYLAKAQASQAGLILADPQADLKGRPLLVMTNPYWGFAQATGWLHPEPEPAWSDGPIHPTARVSVDARLAPGVTVGARTVIGSRCVLHPGVHIGDDFVLGVSATVLAAHTLTGPVHRQCSFLTGKEGPSRGPLPPSRGSFGRCAGTCGRWSVWK